MTEEERTSNGTLAKARETFRKRSKYLSYRMLDSRSGENDEGGDAKV